MRLAPCTRHAVTLCPVDEWQEHRFDASGRAGRLAIHAHGTDRSGEPRYLCLVCRKTFSLGRWHAHTAKPPRDFASFKDQLMHEVLWSVRCEGLKLNAAARRVGVDWATARAWTEGLELRLLRAKRNICRELDEEQVREARRDRLSALHPSEFGITNPKQARWYLAACAAERLYRARRARRLTPAVYRQRLRALTKRNFVGTDLWWYQFTYCTD